MIQQQDPNPGPLLKRSVFATVYLEARRGLRDLLNIGGHQLDELLDENERLINSPHALRNRRLIFCGGRA